MIKKLWPGLHTLIAPKGGTNPARGDAARPAATKAEEYRLKEMQRIMEQQQRDKP